MLRVVRRVVVRRVRRVCVARVVRGRFLAMRRVDFVTAALLDGASEMRVMWRHMLPSSSATLTNTAPASSAPRRRTAPKMPSVWQRRK